MTTLIIFFLLALVLSFVCSLMESVLLSITRAHIGIQINKGRKSGKIIKKMKARIDKPLAAILTLNTIANTVGAAVVGAQSLNIFGSQWVALVSAILTFSILILSEIIPKTLGAMYWKKLSPVAAYVINLMILVTYPLVLLLNAISYLITRNRKPAHLTREELLTLAQLGEHEGILLKKETRIIENLFRLNKIYASDVLTPRSVILAFQQDQTVEEVVKNTIRYRSHRYRYMIKILTMSLGWYSVRKFWRCILRIIQALP